MCLEKCYFQTERFWKELHWKARKFISVEFKGKRKHSVCFIHNVIWKYELCFIFYFLHEIGCEEWRKM